MAMALSGTKSLAEKTERQTPEPEDDSSPWTPTRKAIVGLAVALGVVLLLWLATSIYSRCKRPSRRSPSSQELDSTPTKDVPSESSNGGGSAQVGELVEFEDAGNDTTYHAAIVHQEPKSVQKPWKPPVAVMTRYRVVSLEK